MSHKPPKPFQEATVAAAFARLAGRAGSRRFLVADEVGLGKTIVARGVIEKLAATREGARPPRVFYVCSSLSIAHQNTERLLDGLTNEQREAAAVRVDRLGLVPRMGPLRPAPFHLYSLTPGTSIQPGGSGQFMERILLGRALQAICGVRAHEWFHEILRGNMRMTRWGELWEQTRWPERSGAYLERFERRLQSALGMGASAGRTTMRDAVKERLRDPERLRKTFTLLRRAMILAVIDVVAPDLVIFDEFQRFFDVIATEVDEENDDEDRAEGAFDVLRAMLDPDTDAASPSSSRPAVLLLSATPYRLFARLRDGEKHHEEFFKLLRFLFADTHAENLRALRHDFAEYRRALVHHPVGSEHAREIKQRIEQRLCLVMARTERGQLVLRGPAKRRLGKVAIEPQDLQVFRHLAEAVRIKDRAAVEPYWSSIPYPLQMMGLDYVASRHAEHRPRTKLARSAKLARTSIEDYSHAGWAHPKLRALLAHLPDVLLSLPWLPPSRPWWPLGRPFSLASDATKALVFSRYRAVPRAIATLLTYEAERRAFGKRMGKKRYSYFRDRSTVDRKLRRLRPLPSEEFNFGRSPTHDRKILAMFLPLRALARFGDPFAIPGIEHGTLSGDKAKAAVRARLSAELGSDSERRGHDPLAWALVLERKEDWEPFHGAMHAWLTQHESKHRQAGAAVRQMLGNELPNGAPTPNELDELADLAITAPGIVLSRAVQRVFGDKVTVKSCQARQTSLVGLTLGVLRTYLDGAEWHRIFKRPKRGGARSGYFEAVRESVWAGSLEAVFDEYLVLLQGFGTSAPLADHEYIALEELEKVLGISSVTLLVHTVGSDQEAMRLRSHVAMPFGIRPRAEEEREVLRADLVRTAFNSPFRPMVLATTSIGQEGLDFHRYCRHVVHWDLPRNPVDLEQREGRVERHGGLAVRKALAARIRLASADRSPWHLLAEELHAQERAGGLEPWWHTDGAELLRTVVMPYFSEQDARLTALEHDLALYRHALGQPDQDAFVRALSRRWEQGDEQERTALNHWLEKAALDLCPLGLDQRGIGKRSTP